MRPIKLGANAIELISQLDRLCWIPSRVRGSAGSRVVRHPSGSNPLRQTPNRPGRRHFFFGSQDAPQDGALGFENLFQTFGLNSASCVDLLGKLFEITVDIADSSSWSA